MRAEAKSEAGICGVLAQPEPEFKTGCGSEDLVPALGAFGPRGKPEQDAPGSGGALQIVPLPVEFTTKVTLYPLEQMRFKLLGQAFALAWTNHYHILRLFQDVADRFLVPITSRTDGPGQKDAGPVEIFPMPHGEKKPAFGSGGRRRSLVSHERDDVSALLIVKRWGLPGGNAQVEMNR